MKKVGDGGPWRGPSIKEWVERINDGARADVGQVGRWAIPWIVSIGWAPDKKNPHTGR